MERSETVDMPAAGSLPTHAAQDEPALAAGHALGSYKIVRTLGEGGMGRVYLAEHAVIRRRVALKILKRDLVDSQRAVERFFAEAEAVNRIRHPGIVEVTDLFIADGTPCIVMELLEGQTLASEIALGPLAPARVVAIAREIAAALAATHAAGVVHRDLKPDNIFLATGKDGSSSVKVLDFGVAKLADGMPTSSGQTALGSILGTPEYMAPEQLAGKSVDQRVDVYALGITLYHAVCGHVPFAGASFGDLVIKHMTQPPPPLRVQGAVVPPGLDRAISLMLAKDAQDRPSSMADVDALLLEALTWRPARGRRVLVAAALTAAAALSVGAAWSMGAFEQRQPDPNVVRIDDTPPITPPIMPVALPPPPVLLPEPTIDVAPEAAPAKVLPIKKKPAKVAAPIVFDEPVPEPVVEKPVKKRAVLDPFAEGG